MGAVLSLDHEPAQLGAIKSAEQEYLDYCGAKPQERWLDLPESSPDLEGLSKIRVLQVGADTGPLAIFLHGGGGLAADWAPIMKHLKQNRRYWFLERPGHGVSDPFDYLSISDRIDKHAAAYIDAVREVAGIEKVDIIANSAGGFMSYYYAMYHPERIKSFTWIGAPAFFEGQDLPFSFRVLGSWIGTQIMARPPPDSLPSDLHLKMHNQKEEGIPECYVELYRAIMSSRNTSLSWNYLLRAFYLHKSTYEYSLDSLGTVLTKDMNPTLIVGDSEPFISAEQLKKIESEFGKPNIVIGQGHVPWHDDPEGMAQAVEKILM